MKTMNVLPIISTHFSLGRSIIVSDPPRGNLTQYPVSCFDLVIQNNLDTLVVVDNSISGFIVLNKNAIDAKIKLIYGLKLTLCQNMDDKSPESLKTEAKFIIFIKNDKGYKDLIKISSKACTDGFYYRPRLDFDKLKELWDEESLSLAVPFYDSFLHLNTLESHLHVPNLSFAKPVFLTEDNDLPFDFLIKRRIDEYTKANGYEQVRSQSIFYPDAEDFIAYMTFRCINERTTLDKPNLSHLSSDTFSFNRFLKINDAKT